MSDPIRVTATPIPPQTITITERAADGSEIIVDTRSELWRGSTFRVVTIGSGTIDLNAKTSGESK